MRALRPAPSPCLLPLVLALSVLLWPAGQAAGEDAGAARSPGREVTVAVLQAGEDHGKDGNPGFEANWALFERLAREAATARPDVIVFPEYSISGWPYPGGERINELAETIPGDGKGYQRHVALARELHTPILGWLVRREGGKLYNASFLLGASGELVGAYEKVHANLGEQTWWGWSQGGGFHVLELNGVRYGVSLCADMWFPETVRCYELLGADVVIHQSIGDDMSHIIPVRAFDSSLPIVCAIFQGGSYAVDARGEVLAKLPAAPPGWKSFTLRPFEAHSEPRYGGRWIPALGQRNLRNVGAYSVLVDPATRPRWTEVFLDDEGRPQSEAQLRARFHDRWDARDPAAAAPRSTTTLGIVGDRFTINGEEALLGGISYYSGAGASEEAIRRDLADLKALGFDWLRIWCVWGRFGKDVSALEPAGAAREPYFARLAWIVRECDRRGMVVDLTLTRGKSPAGPGIRDLKGHLAAVETLVERLRAERNWYLDLANERDVEDDRYVNVHELRVLRDRVKELDPARLVTASSGSDLTRVGLADLVSTVLVDFVCPHRPRRRGSPGETEAKTREYLGWMRELGRVVPVHYQEPFRLGYAAWEPAPEDFLEDLRGAIAGGAAGWCYHNGDQRGAPEDRPRRSFDLGEARLLEQLTPGERALLPRLAEAFGEAR